MNRGKKTILIVLIVSSFLLALSVFLQVSGVISTGFYGFGVDSKENLYIGKDQKIDVYNNGAHLYSIPIHTRTYKFTIQNDLIILVTPEQVLHIDLKGTILSKEDNRSMYYSMPLHSKQFISESQKHYVLRHSLFERKSIICIEDNTEIYYFPFLDQMIQVLFPVIGLSFIISIIVLVLPLKK